MKLVTAIKQHLTESGSQDGPYDRAVELIDDGHRLLPLLDFIACVYNGGVTETILNQSRVEFDEVVECLDDLVTNHSSGTANLDTSEANWLLSALHELADTAQEYRDNLRSADEDEGNEITEEFDQLDEVQELENWMYDEANMNPLLELMLANAA